MPGGAPKSPGRPKRDVEQAYYDITIGKVPPEDWQAIVEKAVTQAKAGDHEARKWLGDYVLGKPTQRTELTGADGGPVESKIDLSGLTDDQLKFLTDNLKD